MNTVALIHIKTADSPNRASLLGLRRLCPWQAGSLWQYASVSTITPHSNAPEGSRFTRRQPISSGATAWAGRVKKLWGRVGKSSMDWGLARAGWP